MQMPIHVNGRAEEILNRISEETTSGTPGSAIDAQAEPEFIPVLRPRLPSADSVVEYLRRMDETRIYSNFGPLVIEFQNRLERFLGTSPQSIVSASSGTTAIIGAILAVAGEAAASRPFALMPSFTFAATGVAAERCGFRPFLVDVNPITWAVDPEALEGHPALSKVGVVIVVAPLGRPVRQAPWISFEERTGIPVVIDAAAAFSCIAREPAPFLGPIPTILSLHATKSFGIGEGGCIISTNVEMYAPLVAALNFGFMVSRDSAVPSLNGRLSEYHAAVGLAELDSWAAKWADLEAVATYYRHSFAAVGFEDRFFAFPDVDGNYALYLCASDAEAATVQAQLRKARIDSRLWYDRGLHHHRHFMNVARDELPVTEMLGQRLIGLPMAPDLSENSIKRIVEVVLTTANCAAEMSASSK
jgi:dTDP-4-amino-4,6-dideoxygalactose transaminase